MLGKEAIEWIKSVDKCSESDAIAQLRAAVQDRTVPIQFQGRSEPKLPEGHPLGLYIPQLGPGVSPIQSVDWRTFLMPSVQFRADGKVKFRKTRWQPFEVKRGAMLRFWPKGRVSFSSTEEKCIRWCTDYLKSHGTNVTKKELRKLAIEGFGITNRGFDIRVWPKAIDTAGVKENASRPGRRKKRIG
jgi:hypothetical protein